MNTRIMAVALVCGGFVAIAGQPPTTWYVDDDGDSENGCTSWEDACPELQTGLSLATDGDQVWVAVGTYKPDYDISTGQHTGDREATFQLFTGVEIYGGFDGTESSLEGRAGLFDQTILTGDLNGDDAPQFENYTENSLHTVTIPPQAFNAIVDGFTITGGNAQLAEGGGGMLCKGFSSVVRCCRFINNTAFIRGGGLENVGLFTTVMNCYFEGNVSDINGGGMYNASYATAVTGCTFIDNVAGAGGGGLFELGSTSTISRCKFIANLSFSGGGYNCTGCSPELVDCVFNYNGSYLTGGAAKFTGGTAKLTNCVFSENGASSAGGAVYVSGNIVFSNTILWGNGAPHGGDGVTLEGNTTATISYSVIESGLDSFEIDKNAELIWGPGNIEEDPLFVDADGPDGNTGTEDDDLRLSPGSPCIDAADNTAVPKGVLMDLDGNPRFVDDPNTDDTGFGEPPIVDMGAYEFQFQDPCTDDDSNGKVTICHVPPGNTDNAHTITVSVNAFPAHLAHGDSCGPCEGERSSDSQADRGANNPNRAKPPRSRQVGK